MYALKIKIFVRLEFSAENIKGLIHKNNTILVVSVRLWILHDIECSVYD